MNKHILFAACTLLALSSGIQADDDGGGAGSRTTQGPATHGPSISDRAKDACKQAWNDALPKVKELMNWRDRESLADNVAACGPFNFGQGETADNKEFYSGRNQAIAFKAIVGFWVVKKVVKKIKKAGKKKKHKTHHSHS